MSRGNLNRTIPALPLLAQGHYSQIRAAASGERPIMDFNELVRYSGFAPSAGSESVASYLESVAESIGLENISTQRYPSDGTSYTWAFRGEPYWEGRAATLSLTSPDAELLADFAVIKAHLARFSCTTDCSGPLVSVGAGDHAKYYDGKSVEGSIVLASGDASRVMRLAVWERKALGLVVFRTAQAADFPDQVGIVQLVPWVGPTGQKPTFAFSISNRVGLRLQERLMAGENLTVLAKVAADTGSGAYPVVSAELPGTQPELPQIVVCAHNNSRNTGGANNLTGVGCTLEIARVLHGLITQGVLPRPRRTIRFMWGAEHYGILLHIHAHPEDRARILAMVNIDMIGYNQVTSGAVAHLYRSPHSNPSFIDDIVQSFIEKMGAENSVSVRNFDVLAVKPPDGFFDPLFAPSGTRQQYRYSVEPFWGPSDQEDAHALGIRAAFLGDFPDFFLSTQEDTAAAVDPTQMRRGVVLAAAASYFLSAATAADAHALLLNATLKAQRRIADDEVKAYGYIHAASTGADLARAAHHSVNLMEQTMLRETASLDSLADLLQCADFIERAIPFKSDLAAASEAGLRRIRAGISVQADQLSSSKTAREPLTRADAHADPLHGEARLIPIRAESMSGPVNVFRLEYGRWWLIDKTQDEHFERELPLARRNAYMAYEALNFVDGIRTVADICNALGAEFDPVPISEVAQFFRFMQTCGVVRY